MSLPQKHIMSGKYKKSFSARFIAGASIALLICFNFVPELNSYLASFADEESVSAQAPLTAPTNRYILVSTTTSGNLNQCTIRAASSLYNTLAEQCDLAEAIIKANADTAGDTISIIFNKNISEISLATELPAINRPNNGQLVIDGVGNNGTSDKVILREITRSTASLDYFFRIGGTSSQFVKIRNFAFTNLQAPAAYAITTDTLVTDETETALLNYLEVNNNYFGTRNGRVLDNTDRIAGAINLSLPPTSLDSSRPSIHIHHNNFYNVSGTSVRIAAVEGDAKCNRIAEASTISIRNNTIGLATNFTIDPGTSNGGAWEGTAISLCGIKNATITDNTISNSVKDSFFNTAIALLRSTAKVTRNSIGTTPENDHSSIYGYGISLVENTTPITSISYQDATSYVYGNTIQNLKSPPLEETDSNCLPFQSTSARGNACGGTGIFIFASSANWIYGNTIGNEDFPNDGYGIELLGAATEDIIGVSTNNKIFSNTISYNRADGIQIDSIYDPATEEYFSNNACTGIGESGYTQIVTNNCFNTIVQNSIFRNGAFNGESINTGAESNDGGIGIDLKNITDSSEQKFGTTPYTGSGTYNDLDISENDNNDADRGGNDVLNYPHIEPFNLENTASGSTMYEIRGDLASSINGKYWVEVFLVQCPADGGSTPAISELNAFENCDTDSIDRASQKGESSGQGYQFLCGTLVDKTSVAESDDWSCKPSDFASSSPTPIPTQGLVVATATKFMFDAIYNIPPSYSTTNLNIGLPETFLNAHTQFNCEIAVEFIANLESRCGGLASPDTARNFNDYEYYIMRSLGNTSEFSQAVFLPPSQVTISTTVRACTDLTTTSCTDAFQRNITGFAGDVVEFRVEVTNTSSDTAINIDSLLSQITSGIALQSSSCQLFLNQSTTPNTTRPTSGATNCAAYIINTQNLDYTPTSAVTLNAGQKAIVYVLGQISASATPGTYQNTSSVEVANICDPDLGTSCSSIATVDVVAEPSFSLTKEIVSPNTDSNTALETVQSSSSAQTVNYRITANFHNLSYSAVANYGITDNFPTAIRTGKVITYQNCTYQIFYSDDTDGGSGPCDNATSINSTNTTTLTIWSGSHFPDTAAASYGIRVVITYQAVIPSEALTSSDTNKQIVNTASWTGPYAEEAARTDSATLTITPPATTGGTTLTKTVTPAEITLGSSAQTVTYTIRLVKPAGEAIPSFVWTDTFPTASTTGTPFTITYANCQVTIEPLSSSSLPCSSSFPSTNFTSGNTINANTETIVFTYTATIQPTAITTAQTVTNTTNFAAETSLGNKLVISRDANLTIRPASSSGGTATPTIVKRADNNVTSASRTAERIYKPGDTVNYTLTFSNTGSAAAASVTASDRLPDNLNNVTLGTQTGLTATVSGRTLSIPAFNLSTGTNQASLTYQATLESRSDYDLDNADLDTDADERDDDFFLDDNADLDTDIPSRNNSHRREDDILGAPDGKALSLNDDGSVTIDLGEKRIVNGTGPDFGIATLLNLAGDTDSSTARYKVSVSQDGITFTNIGGDDNEESENFDLRRVNLPWIRFIQITDTSSTVKGPAPGTDVDAVCLFNIGVEEINQAALTYNGTTFRTSAPIVVDITSTFRNKPDPDNCTAPAVQPADDKAPLPLPPALSPPPVSRNQPTPVPPAPTLPKTGVQMIAAVLASGAFMLVKRKWSKNKN